MVARSGVAVYILEVYAKEFPDGLDDGCEKERC